MFVCKGNPPLTQPMTGKYFKTDIHSYQPAEILTVLCDRTLTPRVSILHILSASPPDTHTHTLAVSLRHTFKYVKVNLKEHSAAVSTCMLCPQCVSLTLDLKSVFIKRRLLCVTFWFCVCLLMVALCFVYFCVFLVSLWLSHVPVWLLCGSWY